MPRFRPRFVPLQVSMVQLPDFSFGVTLYEALNLMILPGLEAFVHYFIRDIMLRPFVLPESVTIPLEVCLESGVVHHALPPALRTAI